MNKKYIDLFHLICQSAEALAEQALDENTKKNDEAGIRAATIMHDDFMRLSDLFANPGFSSDSLTRADYAKLMVGTYFAVTQINSRIERDKKALNGYQIDVLPKLDQLINFDDKDEEGLKKLASQLFAIEEKSDT